MLTSRASTRRAALAGFLLFAAALLAVGPAEASRTTAETRPELASLERSPLEPHESVESSPRFGVGEDLGLLDVEARPCGFELGGVGTSRCALTYARNNPLRFVDPDGKAAMAALLIPAAQAMAGMAISYVVVDQAFRAFTGRGVDSAFSPTAYQFERGFAQSPLLLSDQANDGSKPPGAGQGEAEGEPTARPDVELSGGRSGEKVKNLTGPADSAVKGGGERIFVTDGQGRVVKDITKDRTKPVIPGKGFGPKQPPTPQELGLLDRVLKLFRKAE